VTGVVLFPEVWLQASEDSPSRQQNLFSVPLGTSLGKLILAYKRAPGTTFIEGSISILVVELNFA
jgi:hypothetical protein